jgi:hypothetical protein
LSVQLRSSSLRALVVIVTSAILHSTL